MNIILEQILFKNPGDFRGPEIAGFTKCFIIAYLNTLHLQNIVLLFDHHIQLHAVLYQRQHSLAIVLPIACVACALAH